METHTAKPWPAGTLLRPASLPWALKQPRGVNHPIATAGRLGRNREHENTLLISKRNWASGEGPSSASVTLLCSDLLSRAFPWAPPAASPGGPSGRRAGSRGPGSELGTRGFRKQACFSGTALGPCLWFRSLCRLPCPAAGPSSAAPWSGPRGRPGTILGVHGGLVSGTRACTP